MTFNRAAAASAPANDGIARSRQFVGNLPGAGLLPRSPKRGMGRGQGGRDSNPRRSLL